MKVDSVPTCVGRQYPASYTESQTCLPVEEFVENFTVSTCLQLHHIYCVHVYMCRCNKTTCAVHCVLLVYILEWKERGRKSIAGILE